MRFGRGTSAFYACAVTLAIGGGMWLLPPTTATAAARAQDCAANGPLAGVTNGLCRVVGGLLDTVGSVGAALTGRQRVDDTADEDLADFDDPAGDESGDDAAGGDAGNPGNTEAVPSPSASAEAPARPDRHIGTGEGVTGDQAAQGGADDRCTGSGCADRREKRAGADDARGGDRDGRRAESRRTPGGEDEAVRRRERTQVGVTRPVRPAGEDAGHARRRPRPKPTPTERPRRADVDKADLSLLWPVPTLPPIAPGGDGRVVTPRKPQDDVMGTALTAALLLSAVVAARVVSIRNARQERPATIPLEPAAARGSRHRLA
ncbi:hypothetical protein GCM10010106_00700 [Thermopolyspora flexuosa]|jgi:hypothetical protein|uniref:Uncharacterized protein n=1 Tax=Thermopolyspora flexuosa TaxID=103836 RepID=A0A543IXT3_9ACTN|nr:hypothetical protein [Thermopolyspora flexuosa]TQM75376.1 hypothetical protein FHX40_2082 [Thermopolyspora flexuosa]GGM58811.1 hypothetical protein GCM10010106_00700 [Thermopolyspora flexuosa]